MRRRGVGYHGAGRMGTMHSGAMGSPGSLGNRIASSKPSGFTAMSPAPKFPGRDGFSLPQGPKAPTFGGITKISKS